MEVTARLDLMSLPVLAPGREAGSGRKWVCAEGTLSGERKETHAFLTLPLGEGSQ